MFKTKYKNYYFWLSFVTSIFGPCIIMNPKIKLFWNSSIASNIGYMVLLIIWLVTFYLKPELLQMPGHVTEILDMNIFLPTMLAIIPLTSIVSWILVIYSKDEYRQPFDSKYLRITTPECPTQMNSVEYTKNGEHGSVQINLNVSTIAGTDEPTIESITEIK